MTARPDESPDSEPKRMSLADEHYQPVAVRSTYAPPVQSMSFDSGSPLPSRRALRQLAAADEPALTETAEVAVAGPPPVVTRVPDFAEAAALPHDVELPQASESPQTPEFTETQFSTEPVAALPPPLWTEPETAVAAPGAVSAAAPAVVAASVASVPAAPSTSVTDPDDDWAASLAGWDDVEATSATPPDAQPIFGDAPPISYSQRAMRYKPLHGRTSPVWLIVFMPLLHSAALVGSLFLFPAALAVYASPESLRPDAPTIAAMGEWLIFAAVPLAIAFFLFTLIMGFQDRARLRLLGHDQTASPWWIVLHPLVYLIVRSVRVRQCTGRRGSGPLTTYLCLYVAPPIALAVTTAVLSALDGAIPV